MRRSPNRNTPVRVCILGSCGIVVNPFFNLINTVDGIFSDVVSFGDETTNHTVGIFVGASFPGRIRVSIIEFNMSLFAKSGTLHLLHVEKLAPVIGCNRLEHRSEWANSHRSFDRFEGLQNRCLCFIRKFSHP